ncbi:MAG: hypothetical protein ACTSRK_14905 [Promethearchaeota archaeon]
MRKKRKFSLTGVVRSPGLNFILKDFSSGLRFIQNNQNGWWDDHVFFDRKKRKQIQNVWIARTTTSV